ncbi:MAG: S41 family peptidase [Coleofasciculaceae cyanobacterium SM2_3_26]|nr:S41 family peptidase [Coleofasciculaceae cyanobacterium SM2_3_26]
MNQTIFFCLRSFSLSNLAIAASLSLTLLMPEATKPAHAALEDSPKVVLDEAWQIVNQHYVDSTFNQVSWQQVREDLLDTNYTSKQEAYDALRQALALLEDPYTRFLDPKQFEDLTNQTAGELSGVGIRMERPANTRLLKVVDVLDNSPASRAGIQAGDRILEIDGIPTSNLEPSEAAERIRGTVGTAVTLKLERGAQGGMEITLMRERIELASVLYELKQESDHRIGYIKLVEFSSHAGEQMERAIKALQEEEVDAFVLDLRGNPGGLLNISIDIARMWLENGAIVRTVDRDGKDENIAANYTSLTDLPLAVLVDGGSASASEILAGALKDNKRATIIGEQTFGKALVQSVHSLSDGSGLVVTVAHYYTPDGTDISQRGITPQIPVNLTAAQERLLQANPALVGTQHDPPYRSAIALLLGAVPLAAN